MIYEDSKLLKNFLFKSELCRIFTKYFVFLMKCHINSMEKQKKQPRVNFVTGAFLLTTAVVLSMLLNAVALSDDYKCLVKC